MIDAKSFWSHLDATVRDMEHQRNLAGQTTAKCTAPNCDRGVTRHGYTDYDSYGGIWRDTEYCRECGGNGRVEIACSPELEAAALEREIGKLKERLRAVKKRCKK